MCSQMARRKTPKRKVPKRSQPKSPAEDKHKSKKPASLHANLQVFLYDEDDKQAEDPLEDFLHLRDVEANLLSLRTFEPAQSKKLAQLLEKTESSVSQHIPQVINVSASTSRILTRAKFNAAEIALVQGTAMLVDSAKDNLGASLCGGCRGIRKEVVAEQVVRRCYLSFW